MLTTPLLGCVGLPGSMNSSKLSVKVEDLVKTISTLSRGIVENRHGLDWVCCGYWKGGCMGASASRQMGPHGILWGVVPPYGKPPAPDEEQNSHSSCLCLCHLRLQAIEL